MTWSDKLKNISILIPVRNGIQYFERMKKSILENCSNSDEIVIVEDGSTDGVEKLISKWESEDNRIRVVKNDGKGLVDALNLGLRVAKNEWVARVDIDDMYDHNRINFQKLLITNNVVGIFSDYSVVSESGSYLGTITSAVSPAAVAVSLISSQRTAHPSVLFNKSAVLAVGGYRVEDFPAEDLSLWLRLTRVGDLVSAPQVLLKYQMSTNSISALKRAEMLNKKNQLIKNIGIQRSDFSKVSSDWQDFFTNYDNLALANQRKLLLLRDFVISSNYLEEFINVKKEIKAMTFDVFTELGSYIELSRLTYYKIIKKIVRI